METAPGKYTMALREPMGVAGIIAPWESEKGGYKQSGLRRLNGASAIEDFVEYRTIIHEVKL
jgi:acyl-CoA reductase-like NAD-dependent aldehyde dehydrogenase